MHMRRVHVQLSDAQATALEREGRESGRTASAVLGNVVDEWMARNERMALWERAVASVGGFHSGLGNVSEEHDRYLEADPAP
jgi:hypothetical protein